MNFTYLFIDALKKVVNKCKKTIAQDIFFDQAINQLVDLIKRARLEHDLGIPASYYFRAVPESWDDILAVEVDPDGLVFDSESIRTERITEDADCEGIRVRFNGFLGTARISMQIDIGFGDIIYPEPEKAELPCKLDFRHHLYAL